MKYNKKNKYAHLNEPQAEFDYHGLDPFLKEDEIVDITNNQIEEFKKSGKTIIRLITGKGNRSKNGPVIKPIVLRALQSLKASKKIKDFDFETHFTGPNIGAVIVKL